MILFHLHRPFSDPPSLLKEGSVIFKLFVEVPFTLRQLSVKYVLKGQTLITVVPEDLQAEKKNRMNNVGYYHLNTQDKEVSFFACQQYCLAIHKALFCTSAQGSRLKNCMYGVGHMIKKRAKLPERISTN